MSAKVNTRYRVAGCLDSRSAGLSWPGAGLCHLRHGLVLNGGGSPGHVFGPVAGILRAVVVNGLVRERFRLIPHEQKREQLLALTGLIEAGKLTPVLDRTYPLAGTAEGLRRVEQGHARGKVVITVA